MAGMYEDARASQQFDSEVFVGVGRRDSENGVPSALNYKAAAGFLYRDLTIQFGQVGANTRHELWLDCLSLIKQNRRRELNWCTQ